MFSAESDMFLNAASPKVAVITCDVLRDEIAHFRRDLPHVVHVELLEQGLHNEPAKLREGLQRAVDKVEATVPQADAIALGYGLCSRGVEGVVTGRCKLVMARAHDCITLLLGDKDRYAEYVKKHPGTYWYSTGWNRCHTPPGPERHAKLLKQYREKFGDEDAEFLMESEQSWFQTYDRATFVDLGVNDTSKDVSYTGQCAQWLGWKFDAQEGCPQLLKDLMTGPWDAKRFLVLNPGQEVKMTADDRIVEAVDVKLTVKAGRNG